MDPLVGTSRMDREDELTFMSYAYLRELERAHLVRSTLTAYFKTLALAFGK